MATLGQLLQHTGARMGSQDKNAQLMLAISQLLAGTGKTFSTFAELGRAQKAERRSAQRFAWEKSDRPYFEAKRDLEMRRIQAEIADFEEKRKRETERDIAQTEITSIQADEAGQRKEDLVRKKQLLAFPVRFNSTVAEIIKKDDITSADTATLYQLIDNEARTRLSLGEPANQILADLSKDVGPHLRKNPELFGYAPIESIIKGYGVSGAFSQEGIQSLPNANEVALEMFESDPLSAVVLRSLSDKEGRLTTAAKVGAFSSLGKALSQSRTEEGIAKLKNLQEVSRRFGTPLGQALSETVRGTFPSGIGGLSAIGGDTDIRRKSSRAVPGGVGAMPSFRTAPVSFSHPLLPDKYNTREEVIAELERVGVDRRILKALEAAGIK